MAKHPAILVISDEERIATVVKNNLQTAGLTAYWSSSGDVGLRLAFEFVPEMILLDWMLPDVDGLNVLRQLKEDIHTRGIPVVMMTTTAMESEVGQALAMGAADYIVKPFDWANLRETIDATLAPIRPHRPAKQE